MIEIIKGYSNGYAFNFDNKCYTLLKTYTKEKREFGTKRKTGEIVDCIEVIGYYADIKTMLKTVLNLETKIVADDLGVKTLRDYLDIMRQIQQVITDAMEGIEDDT